MLYIRRSDGAYVSFSGMTPEQIEGMLGEQNLQCEFLDEATYNAATAALQPGGNQ